MRALVVNSLDGLGSVSLGTAPEPALSDLVEPAVLVEVRAAGLAFPDVLMTRGEYQGRPEPPFSPGIEVAGVVVEADPGTGFEQGQRVAAHCAYGGLAERAVVPALTTFPLPPELDFLAGGGLVVNYHTAVFALQSRASLQAGETILVHGAAGGLGTAVLQVARGLGARSVAVVSSEAKATVAREAGAHDVIIGGPGWDDRVRSLLGGERVDAVFDSVGGEVTTPSLRLLAPDGRLVIAGFAGGSIPEIRANRLLLRNIGVLGAGWGAYLRRRPQAAEPVATTVGRLVTEGHARPLITRVHVLADALEGLRAIEAREALGKLVVDVSRGS